MRLRPGEAKWTFFIREYLTADVQAAAFGARVYCPRGDLQTGRLIEPTRKTALKEDQPLGSSLGGFSLRLVPLVISRPRVDVGARGVRSQIAYARLTRTACTCEQQ
jgi:hypothetical protein